MLRFKWLDQKAQVFQVIETSMSANGTTIKTVDYDLANKVSRCDNNPWKPVTPEQYQYVRNWYLPKLDGSELILEDMNFERISWDSNGNPRYVISWLALLGHKGFRDYINQFPPHHQFTMARELVKGSILSKYRAKSHSGSFVLQSFNLQSSVNHLNEVLNNRLAKFNAKHK